MKLGAGDLEFNGPETFWADVERVTGKSGLGANLDLAMAGESSPRVWLFLHEPGQEGLSAAAALSIARQLAARDQAVLILDGDDQVCRLSRWAGRHEEEGWIDMVRYGASVLTSGTALPFPGRRSYLIGVGSFNPTEVELQEAHDLVARLRRQADDLILVAPHGPLGLLWARVADIRLFCWDQEERGAREMEDVCAEYEQAGDQLTGLVAYTGAVVDQAGVPSELDRKRGARGRNGNRPRTRPSRKRPRRRSEPVPGDEAPVSPEFEDQDTVVHDFGPAAEEDEPDSAGEGPGRGRRRRGGPPGRGATCSPWPGPGIRAGGRPGFSGASPGWPWSSWWWFRSSTGSRFASRGRWPRTRAPRTRWPRARLPRTRGFLPRPSSPVTAV